LSDETEELFTDKVNCLLVQRGSAEALAESISWGYHHQGELAEIARQGRLTYEKYYSMEILNRDLNIFINNIYTSMSQ
jgi:hypothetical protein